MSNRYIHRYFLPQRQYDAGSPVILAAGALLEDTKTPRLVVQLKFESISPRIIASLRVKIRCFTQDSEEVQGVTALYENLFVQKTQLFGQYTAIVLPETNAYSFSATVLSVRFSDGTSWTAQSPVGTTAPGRPPPAGPASYPLSLRTAQDGPPP